MWTEHSRHVVKELDQGRVLVPSFVRIGDTLCANGKDLVERRQLMAKTGLKWRTQVFESVG